MGILKNTHVSEPLFELRSRPKPECTAREKSIMERRGLVIQHDVIRARNPHDEGATSYTQQGQQIVHVILVRVSMIGVTDVAAHG